jgi:hypothetical protein
LKKSLIILSEKERTPPTEAKLFNFGVNDTLKGDFILTRSGAQEVMMRHREHGVDLMLDFEHHSLDKDATPEQKKASGWGDLELRSDGLYLVNIRWTPEAKKYLSNAEYRYLSPAFNVNEENEIIELVCVALTNLPATNDQPELVAANRIILRTEKSMHNIGKQLSAALEKHGGPEGLSKMLGWDHEKLSKHVNGEPVTQEEMSLCMSKLGIEKEPIDASLDGMDVNHSKASAGEHGDALAGLFELMSSGESNVPHNSGESDENQNGMRLSRLAAEQLVKLTGTKDPKALADIIVSLQAKASASENDSKQLVELRKTIEASHREQLMTASRGKLTPQLVSLARRMPIKDLKDFLAALPEPKKELTELATNTGEGARTMIELSRDEKTLCKTTRTDEKVFAAHKLTLVPEEIVSCGRRTPAADNATQSDWERTYRDHVQSLSMFGETKDGKAWKPASGSRLILTSRTSAE